MAQLGRVSIELFIALVSIKASAMDWQFVPANLKDGKFNLAHLLAGSEGTLAVIRRATMNLVSKPEYTILGILAYGSIAEACDAVPDLLKRNPSAIELIPQLILRLARSIPAYASQMGWMTGDPSALLVVEFSGDQPEVLKEAAKKLSDDVIIAKSAEDQARIWNIRKVGLGILDSRPQSAPAGCIYRRLCHPG